MYKLRLLNYLIPFFLISVLLANCRETGIEKVVSEGRILAKRNCSGCHQMPEPELLDKVTWTKHILPAMASGLGIGVWSGTEYYKSPSSKSGISLEDWNKIVEYYKLAAPVSLHAAKAPTPLISDWVNFKLHVPATKNKADAASTMLVFDTLTHSFFTGDALTNTVTQWDKNLKPLNSIKVKSAPVNAYFTKKNTGTDPRSMVLTTIGSFQAFDNPNGSVEESDITGRSKPVLIAGGLYRPVQTLMADFNKDGLADYVVCSFGHKEGGLELFTQTKSGSFNRSPIRMVPGPEQMVIGDFNHDGWPDLIVLFAQADEGIWMFTNNQHGGFISRNLLHFPPVWGSTSFQLVDFNHDGNPDILYTCGDNADYSMILKPYHGVYIYTNKGNWNFKKSWFYPINGCTKAIASDFRHTGNFDIASIAFYADLIHTPQESFIYFRQDKPLKFSAHAIPVSGYGRWITMTVADYDQDGDDDILLGSFSIPYITGKNANKLRETKNPFIVLENTLISKN